MPVLSSLAWLSIAFCCWWHVRVLSLFAHFWCTWAIFCFAIAFAFWSFFLDAHTAAESSERISPHAESSEVISQYVFLSPARYFFFLAGETSKNKPRIYEFSNKHRLGGKATQINWGDNTIGQTTNRVTKHMLGTDCGHRPNPNNRWEWMGGGRWRCC